MVDYIEFEGKKFPVRMGMIAIKEFEANGDNLTLIGEDLRKHAKFLWLSIKTGYEKIGKPFYKVVKNGDKETEIPAISEDECYWILDDINGFKQYFDIFIKSMAVLSDQTPDNFKKAIKEELKKR